MSAQKRISFPSFTNCTKPMRGKNHTWATFLFDTSLNKIIARVTYQYSELREFKFVINKITKLLRLIFWVLQMKMIETLLFLLDVTVNYLIISTTIMSDLDTFAKLLL